MKNNYKVIKQAISKELADFVYSYFLTKRQVARTFFDDRYISPFNNDWGVWNDPQVPETYSHYSDIAMETLLEKLVEPMSKETGLNLIPTYSYARIYKKGDVLKRHKDRYSCEVSMTMNLVVTHGQSLEPSGETGKECKNDLELVTLSFMRLKLNIGVKHLRVKTGQVFLHNNASGKMLKI